VPTLLFLQQGAVEAAVLSQAFFFPLASRARTFVYGCDARIHVPSCRPDLYTTPLSRRKDWSFSRKASPNIPTFLSAEPFHFFPPGTAPLGGGVCFADSPPSRDPPEFLSFDFPLRASAVEGRDFLTSCCMVVGFSRDELWNFGVVATALFF